MLFSALLREIRKVTNYLCLHYNLLTNGPDDITVTGKWPVTKKNVKI